MDFEGRARHQPFQVLVGERRSSQLTSADDHFGAGFSQRQKNLQAHRWSLVGKHIYYDARNERGWWVAYALDWRTGKTWPEHEYQIHH